MTGEKKLDLHNAIKKGLDYLNSNINEEYSFMYEVDSFLIGFYRLTPHKGVEYELYFKRNESCCSTVSLNKPVKYLKIVDSSVFGTQQIRKKIINFILPLVSQDLNQKLNSFKKFMKTFENVALYQDNKHSTLTIVYANNHNSSFELEEFMNQFKERTKFLNVKVVNILSNASKTLSRAQLLQLGVDNCCTFNNEKFININNDNDELIFFCDIDIIFNQNFLDICRHNAIKKQKVFFPILYSFYNPNKLINFAHDDNDDDNLSFNLTINKDNGFWRDSGINKILCMLSFFFN